MEDGHNPLGYPMATSVLAIMVALELVRIL